ncbi:phosphatase [Pseudonocardia sulfidoxydans NBRC 16205]|uniref:Phosphatase n=1 Tax=Pseudonocardia sulfidoxydans NBRC 16205 TaxID=1223511 RepID=A0A511DMW9_9PSEU|nr:HAD-IA family hydrolase [Pseudonocardia sulfidoxydans]GEL26152.1 phosphatase [Pseudonocardia sulfidoxydans NBRC 16205]
MQGTGGDATAATTVGTRRLEAVIFDVDGTLADTERDGHRPAFNEAFQRHGVDLDWDVEHYGSLLRITGGHRRIAADLEDRGWDPDDADRVAADIHRTKTALFVERVTAGAFDPRPGLTEFVDGLVDAGIRIAVATTGRRDWAVPLVRHLIGDVVEVMITGDEVERLKPDPEAYLLALRGLGLDASAALALEDSGVGTAAATGAGLATIVVTNGYTATQDFSAAALVLPGYDEGRGDGTAPGDAGPLTARRAIDVHAAWWRDR